ncbi:unnamed protein product [Mucor hiemalis]
MLKNSNTLSISGRDQQLPCLGLDTEESTSAQASMPDKNSAIVLALSRLGSSSRENHVGKNRKFGAYTIDKWKCEALADKTSSAWELPRANETVAVNLATASTDSAFDCIVGTSTV